ncbi:MAG TPA: NAD(P)-dependent oxidoreductase, partial [Labilithrix sp.]
MAVVFVSGTLPGESPKTLAKQHEVVQDERGIASDAFAACAERVEAIVALLTDRIDAALLARAPKLRVVANVAVGVDNVDLAACRARSVVVTNTPDVLTEATADLAFGLLLAAARRIVEGDRLLRAGRFTGWTPTFLLGARVHGSTLGVVGLGRIGRAVARRARGFGLHVLYTQEKPLDPP